MRPLMTATLISIYVAAFFCSLTGQYERPLHLHDLSDLGEIAQPAPMTTAVAVDPVEIKSVAPIVLASLSPVTENFTFVVDLPMPHPRASISPGLMLVAEAIQFIDKRGRDLHVKNPGLWCAEIMNRWLTSIGLKGTGSAMADSFTGWGARSAKPCVGCIAVKHRRGGSHVVVIKEIVGKRIVAISPNGGGDMVKLATYPARVFYAYRTASAAN